jgi:hypothetical protein
MELSRVTASKSKNAKAAKYWRGPQEPVAVSQLRWQLDAVQDFAKTELGNEADQQVQPFLRFLTRSASPRDLHWIDAELQTQTEAAQTHLRQRLAQILGETTFGLEEALWQVVVEFRMAPIPDQFTRTISAAGAVSRLDALKAIIDWSLMELVRDLDLKPQRFRRCERCSAVFYQPTRRAKKFCSPRCAGTVRQARFRKEGKG